MARIERERIERAARIYAGSGDAARALGIRQSSFSRLCKHYGIETPNQRRARHRKAAQAAWTLGAGYLGALV